MCLRMNWSKPKPIFGFMNREELENPIPLKAQYHGSIMVDGVAGKWPNLLSKKVGGAKHIYDMNFQYLEQSLDHAIELGFATKWHFAVGFKPNWVPPLGYDLYDYDDRRAKNLEYMDRVLDRLGAKMDYIEVVNEALQPNGSGYRYTTEVPMDPITHAEIATYFAFAASSAPSALLGINEYGVETPGAKQDTYFDYCVALRDTHGAQIDFVGMQCHLDATDRPTKLELRDSFKRFTDAGFNVHITELDIAVGGIPGPKEHKDGVQEEMARDILWAARDAGVAVVMTWGISDIDSWKYTEELVYPIERPLPFDIENLSKPFWEQIRQHTQ